MSEKKSFLLRLSPELWDELQRMAQAEFRSMNGQIEYILREATKRKGKRGSRKQDGSDTDV